MVEKTVVRQILSKYLKNSQFLGSDSSLSQAFLHVAYICTNLICLYTTSSVGPNKIAFNVLSKYLRPVSWSQENTTDQRTDTFRCQSKTNSEFDFESIETTKGVSISSLSGCSIYLRTNFTFTISGVGVQKHIIIYGQLNSSSSHSYI